LVIIGGGYPTPKKQRGALGAGAILRTWGKYAAITRS